MGIRVTRLRPVKDAAFPIPNSEGPEAPQATCLTLHWRTVSTRRRRIQVSAVDVNVSHGGAREDRPYNHLSAEILDHRRTFFLQFICGATCHQVICRLLFEQFIALFGVFLQHAF
jgi:hypothetical protein